MPSSVTRHVGFAAAVLCAIALPGAVRAQSGDIPIFIGQTSQASGLKLLTWGSGTVKDSEESVYTGVCSLRITTQGLYQGARLVLPKPIDIKQDLSAPNMYLRIAIKTDDKNARGFRGGMMGPMGGMMGGMMGGKMGGMMGGGMPGGMMGGRRGGMYGGRGYGDNSLPGMAKPAPLEDIRLTLTTTDGARAEAMLSYKDAKVGDSDWRTLAIPISSITGLKNSNGELSEIGIFGNAPATLYLGEIRIVRDETPIIIEDMPERTVAVNDEVTFTGNASGGVSPLEYEWTFANAGEFGNGQGTLPVDAVGRTVKHRFRKSGDYVVFLTVRDLNGAKKPAISRVKVHVTL